MVSRSSHILKRVHLVRVVLRVRGDSFKIVLPDAVALGNAAYLLDHEAARNDDTVSPVSVTAAIAIDVGFAL